MPKKKIKFHHQLLQHLKHSLSSITLIKCSLHPLRSSYLIKSSRILKLGFKTLIPRFLLQRQTLWALLLKNSYLYKTKKRSMMAKRKKKTRCREHLQWMLTKALEQLAIEKETLISSLMKLIMTVVIMLLKEERPIRMTLMKF